MIEPSSSTVIKREPFRQYFDDYLKPFLDVRAFVSQTMLILSSPLQSVNPERYSDKKWMSPLTYALVGCSLIFWISTAVELFIVHTVIPRAPIYLEQAIAAAKSRNVEDIEGDSEVRWAREFSSNWKKMSIAERASLGPTIKLEFPLALLFGSYVFRFILEFRDGERPPITASAHEYHLQYVFGIALIPNVIAVIGMLLFILNQYYALPGALSAAGKALPYFALIPSIPAVIYTTRAVASTFDVGFGRAFISLWFANAVGYFGASIFLLLMSRVTAAILSNSAE